MGLCGVYELDHLLDVVLSVGGHGVEHLLHGDVLAGLADCTRLVQHGSGILIHMSVVG